MSTSSPEEGPAAQARTLTELLTWAAQQVPALAEQAFGEIRRRDALYKDDQLVPAATLRESVERNMRFLLDALRHPEGPRDLSAPTETGRHRAAQGMPLAEVLRAYRLSFAVLWGALAERACAQPSREVREPLLRAVATIWRLTDEHALAVTEGYREATAEILRVQHGRRGALVEALLDGQLGPQGSPWEAAQLLGFTPDSRVVGAAALTLRLIPEADPP